MKKTRLDKYLEAVYHGSLSNWARYQPRTKRPNNPPVAHVPEAPTPPPRELTPEEQAEKLAQEKEQEERMARIDEQNKIFKVNAARWDEYKDLGWANSWQKTPDVVKNCPHKYPDKGTIDDQSHRGYENRVFCAKCGWRYRYDSSD